MESPLESTSCSHDSNSPRKKIVLVIDDSADFLSLNRSVLETEDYEVFTALGGDEAFVALEEIAQPDLILLDMRMEDMSGPEFLLALERKRPEIFENVPVVFLTALDKVPASKAVGFIRKPFDIDQFLVAVQGFIERGTGRSQHKH